MISIRDFKIHVLVIPGRELERVKELEAEVVHVREAGGVHHDFSKQQLDELVRLRADLKTARTRVAQLEAALRPFANAGELFLPIGPSDDSGYVHEPDDAPIGNRQVWEGTPLTIGHLRAASRALDGEAGK